MCKMISIEEAEKIYRICEAKYNWKNVSGGRRIGAIELIKTIGEKEAMKLIAKPYQTMAWAVAGLNLMDSKFFRNKHLKQKMYSLARQIDSGYVIFDTGF